MIATLALLVSALALAAVAWSVRSHRQRLAEIRRILATLAKTLAAVDVAQRHEQESARLESARLLQEAATAQNRKLEQLRAEVVGIAVETDATRAAVAAMQSAVAEHAPVVARILEAERLAHEARRAAMQVPTRGAALTARVGQLRDRLRKDDT